MDKQKLIDQFNKNSMEIIKVHIQAWKDNLYFDVRSWILDKPGENGAERPSHKGLTLRIEHLPRLIQSLQLALEEIENARKQQDDSGDSEEGQNGG